MQAAAYMIGVTMVSVLAMLACLIVRRRPSTTFGKCIDALMLTAVLCVLAPGVAVALWAGVDLFFGNNE